MAALSIQYIAGFFDGEGSVGLKHGRSGTYWVLYQSGARGKAVLEEVQAMFPPLVRPPYLNGPIPYKQSPNGIRIPQVGYALIVSYRPDIITLCRWLLPYLRVKRAEVGDLIRFDTLYPGILPGTVPYGMLISEGRRRGRHA